MTCCERDDETVIDSRRTVRQDRYAAVRQTGEHGDLAFDVVGIVLDANGSQLDSELRGRFLGRLQEVVVIDGGLRIS